MAVLKWNGPPRFGWIAPVLAWALLATGAITASAHIPVNYLDSSGGAHPIAWKLSAYPSGIPFVLRTTDTGEGTPDISGTDEFATLRKAFRNWQNVSTSDISFQDLGATQRKVAGALDGINTSGFVSSEMLARAGVLAMAMPTVKTGVPEGEIAECDILFFESDQVLWKTSGRNAFPTSAGARAEINLEEVATREVGHLCGLNSSFVRSPLDRPLFLLQDGVIIHDNRFGPFQSTCLMYPYALDNSPVQNAAYGGGSLTRNEVAAISALYPQTDYAQQFGSISGRITVFNPVDSATSTLCGAHVVALLPGATGPVCSTISGPDGSYRIEGLSPGNYQILVEPSSPDEIQGLFVQLTDAAVDFLPEFFNNAYFRNMSSAQLISVSAGVDTDRIDVEVTKTPRNREVTYASGNQRGEDGEPLVLKIEPDDNILQASRLRDDNDDGEIREDAAIQTPGDIDFYRFHAQRDDVYVVEIFADRIGSQLDPVMSLYGPGQQAVPFATANNTPGLMNDCRLVFTAPETNDYFVEITDFDPTVGDLNHFYILYIKKLSGRIPITPLGGPTAVLSVPISDASLEAVGFTNPTFGHIEITELKAQFLDLDGDAGLNTDGRDFLPPSREANARFGGIEGGFILFNDQGPSRGRFDYDPISPDSRQDQPITMSQAPTIVPFGFGFEVTFRPEEPLVIPAERIGVEDASPDFHIVIQPSIKLHHGDDFQVIIPKDGIRVRNNNSPVLTEATLFAQDYPQPNFRNKYTGDILELIPFTPVGGGTIDAKSTDSAVAGLNLIGDPDEEYWVSQVELSFIGYSYHSIKTLGRFSLTWDGFYDILVPNYQLPDPVIRRWEMTDLLPLTNGVVHSGGVNLYADNDNLGTVGDGVPNFGLDGDFLLPLAGNQRFEVIPNDRITDDRLAALLPHSMQPHVTLSFFLENRDAINFTAFKAILPVVPQSDRRVPDTEVLSEGTLGSDMFMTVRTSNITEALDVFLPYVEIGGIKVSNNLSEVIQFQDPTRSTLVNGGSLRFLDNRTNPSIDIIQVRPKPYIQFRDLVNPSDPLSRGNVIGTTQNGSPPLAVIGIDAHDYGAGARNTFNAVGTGDLPTGNHIINTGLVLESLTLFIDPVENPPVLPVDFILPVQQASEIDPDLIDLPRRGLEIMVDDDTPEGDILLFTDNDGENLRTTGTLIDEELRNGEDDDLDGITDEPDFGDEDTPGLNGQYDPNDDTLVYLHLNDILRFNPVVPYTQYLTPPTVTQANTGLQVDFPDLTARVTSELGFAFDLVTDPLSIFIDAIFYRVDHPLLTLRGGLPAPAPGTVLNYFIPIGFIVDFGDDLVPLFDAGNCTVSYSYLSEFPNSDSIQSLLGPDFFLTTRMGPGASIGDTFRMRIPANGFEYSEYRSANTNTENIRRGAFPFSDYSSSSIRVGSDNVPPQLTYVAPTGTNNQAEAVEENGRISYRFDVSFLFNDSDNTASVDFYWDTDRFGLDGKPIPSFENQVTTNILDNDGERALEFTYVFPEEVARESVAEVFIYGVVTDDVNPSQVVYANSPIILNATSRVGFNTTEFLIADNLGQIFGTGAANVNIPEHRQRTNSIRDIELTPSERGALFLNGFGDVVLRGDPGIWNDFVRTSNSVTFPEGGSINLGADLARDIEPDWFGNRYYLLDGLGHIHVVGAPPPAPFVSMGAPPVLTGLSPSLDDIYRDMELTPTKLGLQVLSGLGTITALGDATPLTGPSFGMDLARDIALPPSGLGAYLLDAYGNIHLIGVSGAVQATTEVPIFPGSDIYRAIEVVSGGSALLVMDREGQVFPVGDLLLGPNPVPDGVITNPPGIPPGNPIVFHPPDNVVVSELGGAFMDLEVLQSGVVSQQAENQIGTNLDGICRAIAQEDLVGLLQFFADNYLDEQGHTKTEVSQVWQAFFNYFTTVGCFITADSVQISRSNEVADTYILSASIGIVTLDPTLKIIGPTDDPTALEGEGEDLPLEERGESFTLGPIQVDQPVRFWETDDGRGWRMRIIDDDNVEGQIDRADRVLDERHFTKTRARSRYEGAGVVYLGEEDQLSRGSSQNSEYIFQFIEEVEGHVNTAGGPTGGWNAPIVYILWLTPSSDTLGDPIPMSTFHVPFQFKVVQDPQTLRFTILGGDAALQSIMPVHLGTAEVTQNDGVDASVESPTGWRFFNPLGIIVDADRPSVYESHLLAEEADAATETVTLRIPDTNSSAYLVNLTDASEAGSLPAGTLPLKADLKPPRTPDGRLILPNFSFFQKTITVQPDDYVLLTFRGDEQLGPRDRLVFAILHIEEANIVGTNNTYKNVMFTWRYKPEEDFILDFIPYKK